MILSNKSNQKSSLSLPKQMPFMIITITVLALGAVRRKNARKTKTRFYSEKVIEFFEMFFNYLL